MNKQKSLKKDAFIWVLLMGLACIIAFSLLKRDKERNFGAVSFGSFPEFELNTIEGKPFNHHLMRNHVWAVHTASSEEQLIATAKRLEFVRKSTASGKRHLYILSFTTSRSSILRPLNAGHFIVIGKQSKLTSIFSSSRVNENSVVLVDQNGIIRGQYNVADVDDYRKFQQDLIRLL